MRAEFLKLAAELAARGEPFALAVVVRREPASSTQPGDMALVTAGGAFHGWLGGTCTQPTVVREARQALADGRPRLLALSPDPGEADMGLLLTISLACTVFCTLFVLPALLGPPRPS